MSYSYPQSHQPHQQSMPQSGETEDALRLPKKLIVCCDGTWMNSDSGWSRPLWPPWAPGELQTPSNVTRLARALKPVTSNHHPQIVYYQAGVGSGWSVADRLWGGGTGEGVSENIREAYNFLAYNYIEADKNTNFEGDKIYLIGFSRGSFTARSVGGLIGGMGLLKKSALPYFYDIFKDWENAGLRGYKPRLPGALPQEWVREKGWNVNHSPNDKRDINEYLDEYRSELVRYGLTREVDIEAIGVFDTVGSLGIPVVPLFQKLGLPTTIHEYKFFDTSIDNHVRNAFHALALDEHRAPFSPTVWEKPQGITTNLKQVWFPGVHSNVGGSLEETGLADITLAWMMSQLSSIKHGLEFDEQYLMQQYEENKKRLLEKSPPETRPWSFGFIKDSNKFPTSLGGSLTRKPGRYMRTDYDSGKETDTPLHNTQEFMHASVRARKEYEGPPYGAARATAEGYNPPALVNWVLTPKDLRNGYENPNNGVRRDKIRWEYTDGEKKDMHEDKLGYYELKLIELWRADARVKGDKGEAVIDYVLRHS